VVTQLDEYLAGQRRVFDLPFRAEGTLFQQDVWAVLRQVEYGTTTTYGEIAAQVGRPGAARAVGAAVGRNPLSLVIPCHRVVGATGLAGYAGGLDRKRHLLALEGVQPATRA
jgi:methylated-DNA-[protein]-cysteine S-methyltransferase